MKDTPHNFAYEIASEASGNIEMMQEDWTYDQSSWNAV